MSKHLLSLFLIWALVLPLIPAAAAEDSPACLSGTVVNPFYEDVEMPAQPRLRRASGNQVTAETRAASYLSPWEAADLLRQAMVSRVSSVDLYIHTEDFWAKSATDNWFSVDFLPMVFSQALSTSPYDGDYLMWSWYKYDWRLQGYTGSDLSFHLDLQYYTTAAQEDSLRQRVESLCAQLGLSSLSREAAYEAVYDYITAHVVYDYQGLATIHDDDDTNNDYMIFTAYGALFDGEAVCQGISTLFYAICRQAGLPVRVITGPNHAWNIVQLRDLWYCVDATWDASTLSRRQWFLLGLDSFGGGQHYRDDTYRTEEFMTAYPMSRFDYDPDMPFTDVTPDSVHYDDIRRAAKLGLFDGTGLYRFSPRVSVNRAMLVTVLWRMEGSPQGGAAPYDDVPPDSYYAQAVSWATGAGIIMGTWDRTFSPDDPATREQLVTILYRYAGYLGRDRSDSASLEDYRDRDQISGYAQESMTWAVGSGLVNGTSDDTLSPLDPTTREQLASLLIRLLDRYAQAENDAREELPDAA